MVPLKAGLDSIALLLQLISLIIGLIIARTVISWFESSHPFARSLSWLKLVTDPFLIPFRRLNLVFGGFDLTPIVAIFTLYLIRKLSVIILVSLYPQ